ncbi:MAG: PQQ-like beta-propeller repeat protein [Verrucomicrobia bacterium]|nr:PQQ-like beta-propeller repeat protein [Verrucomicrobiota bacterium]
MWTHSNEVTFPEWAFVPNAKSGPGSTPIVEAGKVFALALTGRLWCLDASSGTVVWENDLAKNYGLAEFSGTTPSPLIEGNLLILAIGGKPNACVVALDKNSGKEVWRALDDHWTYSSPAVISAGGKRQLIVWTPDAITSLDPATGKTWWREIFNTQNAYGTATPVFHGDLLLFSGSMFQLDPGGMTVSNLWPQSSSPTRRVMSTTSLPVLDGDCVYSDKSHGKLVCLEARTGKQLWQADQLTDHQNGACIHLTPNGDSTLIFTNEGKLIRARLTPRGCEELSRVHLLNPTYDFAGRKLVWPPPAYANRHVFARNDEELVCASLAKKDAHAK